MRTNTVHIWAHGGDVLELIDVTEAPDSVTVHRARFAEWLADRFLLQVETDRVIAEIAVAHGETAAPTVQPGIYSASVEVPTMYPQGAMWDSQDSGIIKINPDGSVIY